MPCPRPQNSPRKPRKTASKTPQNGPPPSHLHDLAPDPANPRTITDAAARRLADSLRVYGDLSGIVYNAATRHLICAHQRRAAIPPDGLSRITWSPPHTCTLGHPAARFASVERHGAFTTADGARFTVRLVTWPPDFEREANIAANNPELHGAWADDIASVLSAVCDALPADAADVGLHALLDACTPPAFEPGAAGEQPSLDAYKMAKCPECGHEFRA